MEKIESELAAGYQRIKVKVKPGWDVAVLARIRKRWPKIVLSCDANSAYRLEDFEHLKKFDEFGLLMIEQPLWSDEIFQHAALQKQLKTDICLDEQVFELHPGVPARVVLPHVVLRLGGSATEEHGTAIRAIEGGADPAAGPRRGSTSLCPGRRPALALGGSGHEEERSQSSGQSEEKEANQGSA